MKTILVKIIRAYQILLSPVLGNRCRFLPTCSHYSIEAICEHGSLKGSFLTAKRILKCHPFHPGGLDPVPKVSSANAGEKIVNEMSEQEKTING